MNSPADVVISGGDAFVTDNNTNSVTEFDVATGSLVRILRAAKSDYATREYVDPTGIAISGDDAFVTCANAITEFRTTTGALVREMQ
jgi:DNA-binding beta-propeller fold protein YncE